MDARKSLRRNISMTILVAVAVASVLVSPVPEARGASATRPVSSALLAKGLEAKGRVVRRDAGVSIARVRVPHRGNTVTLYRVRVAGDFPPRALRYEILADGERLDFGVPTASTRAVRTVTRWDGVLRAAIRARYEAPRAPAGETRTTTMSAPLGGAGGTMPDPSAPGPLSVAEDIYHLGDEVFQPTDIGAKIELTGEVMYPQGLPGGPYPFVLFLHGNHATCFKGDRADFRWPCREG